MHILYSSMASKEMNMKFLGAGCSRMAYSVGDGICLKVPIKERVEVGIWQNKLEYENFRIGRDFKLVCFPKPKRHNRDFSKIWVEECKTFKTEQDFLDALDLPAEWTNHLVGASTMCNIPVAQFIGFYIFGWLEETTAEQAVNMTMDEADRKTMAELLPFKTMNDISSFLDIARRGNTAWSSHACLVANVIARSQVLLDVLKFKIAHPERLYIKDIWNFNQWGLSSSGKLVVIDAGYNHTIANSHHFNRGGCLVKDAIRSDDLETFNGVKCSEIFSKTGSPVEWKFFTSHGTEYILSSVGQARRIKQAGLNDDGLYPWMDKMVFVEEKDAIDAMNTIVNIQKTLTPVKVLTSWEPQTKLDIQKLVNDQWQTQLSVVIQNDKPEVGKNVLEFNLDGSLIKNFHAGHDVVKIKHFGLT